MNGKAAGKLLAPDRYQVFLMASPATFPLTFARHPWFVVNKKGSVSRWEVAWRPSRYKGEKQWGHIVLNMLPPFRGLGIVHSTSQLHWNGRVLDMVEGGEDSLAARMANFIERSPDTYPFTARYAFRGPNSNTYAQWVLNHFPEARMTLQWNAFGRGFRIP